MSLSSSNVSGSPFYKVVVKEEPPFVVVTRSPNGNLNYSGFIPDLLKELSKQAKFTYHIKGVDHKSYGHQSHGQWDGLISEIHNGHAHIAAGPIPRGVKEEGNSIVDFTKPYMSTTVNLLVKYPPETTRGIGLMFQPYKAEVWVMLCLAFIAVSLALFLIGRFSPYEWARLTKEKEYRAYRKIFELKNSFFFAATTISLQGYKEAPRSTAGRILVCMWFMFVMCFLLAYTASLGAILTTRGSPSPQSLPFSSYDDILKNKQVKLGAIKYDYIHSAMRSNNLAQDGIVSRLLSYVDSSNEWIQDVDAGIQKVKDLEGKYALVMESVKASYVARSNCDLINYGESLLNLGYCFAVVKNPQLKASLDLSILSLRENGMISKLVQKYFYNSGDCPVYDKSKVAARINPTYSQTANGLDMRDMAVPFLLLFLGVLGAGGALAGEIYYKKKMNDKKEGDPKEREPLNVETGVSRAPKTSPPPPPIYKVNNKLHETSDGNKSDPLEKDSIEIVVVSKKNEVEKDTKASNEEDRESVKAADASSGHSQNSVDQEDDN